MKITDVAVVWGGARRGAARRSASRHKVGRDDGDVPPDAAAAAGPPSPQTRAQATTIYGSLLMQLINKAGPYWALI